MDTDRLFHELFRDHPEWLRELTGLPLPAGCCGSSRTLKQLEIRCDLLLEPEDPQDPCYLVEFQLYHDHSIFNRVELARQILWKHLNPKTDCRRRDFVPREVETVVLFGSSSELPASHDRYPLIRVLFIDELLESLEQRSPGSPLVAALAPLHDSLPKLEKDAAGHYDLIKGNSLLSREDREVLGEIFLLLLLQRFKTKSREELHKMIAELTPLHETRAGKELLEEGIERGMEEGLERGLAKGVKEGLQRGLAKGVKKGVADLVRRMLAKGRTPDEIADLTDLSVAEIACLLAMEED